MVVLWSERTLDSRRTPSRTVVVVTGGTCGCGGRRSATHGGEMVSRALRTVDLTSRAEVTQKTMQEPRPPQRVRFPAMKSFLLILIASLVLVACSSGGDEASVPSASATSSVESDSSTSSTMAAPTTTPTTSAPASTEVEEAPTTEPATEPEAPVEEVLADQIRGYFDARAAANAAPAPNPDDPRLAEFAVGEELAAVVASTQVRLDAGQAIRPGDAGLADIRVGFVDAGASGASAAACAVDDGVIYDLATDAVLNDDVVTHTYQIDLELHDGVWKVGRIVRVQQWEGVAGCALSPADYPF